MDSRETKKRELNLEPTDFIIRGLGEMLRLLHRYGSRRGVPAKALAMALWPHSPGWTNLRHKGKGPTYAATNLLIRMVRMGLAEEAEEGYRLTHNGVMTSLEGLNDKAQREKRKREREKARLGQ